MKSIVRVVLLLLFVAAVTTGIIAACSRVWPSPTPTPQPTATPAEIKLNFPHAQPGSTQTPSSIALNQSAPRYGDTVNFTETAPKAAFVQARQPQFPDNPATQVDCYLVSDGSHAESDHTILVTKINNKDQTFTGITGDITLGANSGANGLFWPSGAATCYVNLYSASEDPQTKTPIITIWAELMFSVGA